MSETHRQLPMNTIEEQAQITKDFTACLVAHTGLSITRHSEAGLHLTGNFYNDCEAVLRFPGKPGTPQFRGALIILQEQIRQPGTLPGHVFNLVREFNNRWLPVACGEAPGEIVTPGTKHDNSKPRYDLLPFLALASVVDVLTFGAKKYADDNWRKVEGWRRRYIAAAFRHMVAWCSGETTDKESGLPHLAHAMCCLMFILELEQEEKPK